MFIQIVLFTFLITKTNCIEPISTTIGITGAGLGMMGYNFGDSIKKHTYCHLTECCIDEHIPSDITSLEKTLKRELFGQHIVQDYLIAVLKSHYEDLEKSKKPLVMSFHGGTGTGKNYVSEFIVKSIFLKGSESKNVHRFIGRVHFPLESESSNYSVQLRDKIIKAVKKCDRSIFIFDEVDKMPSGVLNVMSSLLGAHKAVDGVDFRKTVFIFLTNTGSSEIDKILSDFLELDGREETKLHHFERVCQTAANGMDGGLKNSGLIEFSVIDHYLPFLPMEQEHVEECIRIEFQRLDYTANSGEVAEVMNYIPMNGKFATSGCKRVSKKVAPIVYQKKTT